MTTIDFLAEIFDTSSLPIPIAGDAEGPYPWKICRGRKCPHRVSGTKQCICRFADWTHCVTTGSSTQRRSLALEHAQRRLSNLRESTPDGHVHAAYTPLGDRLLFLICVPRRANAKVYSVLQGVDVDEDVFGHEASATRVWKVLRTKPRNGAKRVSRWFI